MDKRSISGLRQLDFALRGVPSDPPHRRGDDVSERIDSTNPKFNCHFLWQILQLWLRVGLKQRETHKGGKK